MKNSAFVWMKIFQKELEWEFLRMMNRICITGCLTWSCLSSPQFLNSSDSQILARGSAQIKFMIFEEKNLKFEEYLFCKYMEREPGRWNRHCILLFLEDCSWTPRPAENANSKIKLRLRAQFLNNIQRGKFGFRVFNRVPTLHCRG